jgi:hypothetical protein
MAEKTYEPKSGVKGYSFTSALSGRDEPFEPSFPYTTEDPQEQAVLDAQDALKTTEKKGDN